ncbi:MAG: 7-cyano-7-deazaguanine synthase QueC [Paludibacteraceae bacterium]|nr:7-cyano-7-deazaguanine synthase QueC [Paludibacteraceae bacterium]
MKDTLLILSGGLDSVTMLYDYRDRIALAVTFDYGSRHSQNEIPFARHHCRQLGIEHLVISMDFMQRYFHSSLLVGGEPIPEGNYDDDNMRSTIVPFRNGIMLSVAAGLAEDRGLKAVMMANHGGDHAIYPDCRPEFVAAMDGAMQAGTYQHVQLLTPYTDWTKADIVRRGHALGVDYAQTWSCYKGGERQCGRCGTCTERKQAFADAGIPDPTVYQY